MPVFLPTINNNWMPVQASTSCCYRQDNSKLYRRQDTYKQPFFWKATYYADVTKKRHIISVRRNNFEWEAYFGTVCVVQIQNCSVQQETSAF